MYNIVLSAIERGRAVVFLMGVILLSGIAVLINIPKEAEPDIPIPYKACAYRKINTLKYMEPGGGEYYKIKN